MKKGTGIALTLLVAGAVGTAYWLGQHRADIRHEAAMASQAASPGAGSPGRKILYYRNPMGLPDTSPVPKKDPMGMDYTPVYENEDDICAVPGKGCKPEVQISAEKIQKLGVITEPVAMRAVDRIVRAVGKVDASERLIYGISPRYQGWIEKVYVNAIYQLVVKDQPLIEVYSPELVSAQQEYVIAAQAIDRIKRKMAKPAAEEMATPATDSAADKVPYMQHNVMATNTVEHPEPSLAHGMMARDPAARQAPATQSLVAEGLDNIRDADADALAGMERLAESVLDRLRYWEVSEQQIEELKKTRKVKRTLVITAFGPGFIVDKKMIFPGMAFVPGQEIYTMADLLTQVWVIADVFDEDMDLLKMGQAARMTFPARPGQEFIGKVDFIYPIQKDLTRTTQVRIEVENPTAQMFGAMYAKVEFDVGKGRGAVLTAPNSAVISSGTRDVVLVPLGGGRFQPREVKLGMHGENYVEIKDGLAVGEKVVTRANFLIDSESSLKAALSSFEASPSAAGAGVAPAEGMAGMKHEMPAQPDMSSTKQAMPAQPAAAPQGK